MIFQHTWKQVLTGEKTQTRRLIVSRTIQPMFRDLKTGTVIPTDDGETDGEWLYNNTVWHAKPCKMGKGYMGLNYTEAKPKYRIGSTYAVQPGRGKSTLWWKILDGVLCVNPAIEWKPTDTLDGLDYENMIRFDNRATWRKHGYTEGLIRITDIRKEDVRCISDDDVRAEGFNNRGAFFDLWLAMHDADAAKIYSSHAIVPDARNYLWTRPAEHYQAWAIEFELVRS